MSEENLFITCQKCGEPLEADWKQCPVCLTPTSSLGLACPNCQTPVKETWKACPRCGNMLSGAKTPDSGHVPSSVFIRSDSEKIYLSMEQKEPIGTLGFEVEVPIVAGDMLGERYRVVERLGKGGFGSVYQVDDINLNRQIALKVVVAGKGKAQRAAEQLIHEFNLREKINDTTHVIKAQDPRPCEYKGLSLILLPMELADGENLRKWLLQNRDVNKRITTGIEFFRQSCLGIKAIHDADLVHLDIKPENILLVDGKVKIADFGIGRYGANQFANNPEQLLRQGIGTPQYMSPEQFQVARQKDVGPASDIYSLGIVLFEILDGNLPFDGTPIELRDKHLNMQPPRLTGELEKWSRILDKCLAKTPQDRYPDISRLIADINRAAQGATLSIDVSCPKCSHINANPAARECSECKTSLAALFRLCPVCDKSVRLDVETCPACGKAVAAHYMLLNLKERIEKLKDEDPVEAIELLETVLQQETEDYHERAIQLLKDLRKKQSTIKSLTTHAYKAESECLPENAIKAWREILGIIPRHRIALEQIQKLESLIKDFQKRLKKTETLMDEAKYEDADKLLQDCLKMIPTRKDVKEMLGTCRRRAHEYTTIFQQASVSRKYKLIQDADKQINKALLQAPHSSEALTLAAEIREITEKTNKLLHQAKLYLAQANFPEVDSIIRDIEESESNNDAVAILKKELARIRMSYIDSIKAAQSTANLHDLSRVLGLIEKAIKLCPKSPEALSLLEQTKSNQKKANNLIEEMAAAITAAKFEQAEEVLDRVEKLWPTMDSLKDSREKLKETQARYNIHMELAIQSSTAKDLDKALEELQSALAVCQNSIEADSLLKQVQAIQHDAVDRLAAAKKLCSEAEFDKAQEYLRQTQEIWPKIEGLTDIDTMIASSRTNYNINIVNAEKHFNQEKLQEALESCQKALKSCPLAKEAKVLLEQIKRKKLQKRQSREHIEEIFSGITQWGTILVIGGVALAAGIYFVIFIWNKIGLSGEIFFVLMVAHVIYYIIAWPSSNDAIIFSIIALVATGIITLIISSIAVFIFKASWLTGISIGLWPGILICLASILWGAFLIADQK